MYVLQSRNSAFGHSQSSEPYHNPANISTITGAQLLGAHTIALAAVTHYQETGLTTDPVSAISYFPPLNHHGEGLPPLDPYHPTCDCSRFTLASVADRESATEAEQALKDPALGSDSSALNEHQLDPSYLQNDISPVSESKPPPTAFRKLTQAEIEETAVAYGIEVDVLEMQGRELVGWQLQWPVVVNEHVDCETDSEYLSLSVLRNDNIVGS